MIDTLTIMEKEIIDKLRFSIDGKQENFLLPLSIIDSACIISEFFINKINNKLCLVFPTKEYAAQWLSIFMAFSQIDSDFNRFENEIVASIEHFKEGDKIILNNEAVVEWVRKNKYGFVFKHREYMGVNTITININDISKIQSAPANRKVLSSYKRVKDTLRRGNHNHIDKILGIKTNGNKLFLKDSVCMVSKHSDYRKSMNNILLSGFSIEEYFKPGKIDENGDVDLKSPLFIAHNLSNLSLYLMQSQNISMIIIDGFDAIQQRGTDFSDIDSQNLPTILITSLNEIEDFGSINNYGFDFFNFANEHLRIDKEIGNSPFIIFNKKLNVYSSFLIKNELCQNSNFEQLTQKYYAINMDDSNIDLLKIKISLFQLISSLTKIVHIPTTEDIFEYTSKLEYIDTLFNQSKTWLGDSIKPIEECIQIIESIINKISYEPTEKCSKLNLLIEQNKYDYIICPSNYEAKALSEFLNTTTNKIKVIPITDVCGKIFEDKPIKAILTGWTKSSIINRLISVFIFSELTFLFYQFECNYFISLQRKNLLSINFITPTINKHGIPITNKIEIPKDFSGLYSFDIPIDIVEDSFDMMDFELKCENAQLSRYTSKDISISKVNARRLDFESSLFLFSTDSHKFIVLNEMIERQDEKANIKMKKIDSIRPGDVIAFINTDKDILVELVEKSTKSELLSVKQWTELWKNLLKNYFLEIGSDFRKLIVDLRKQGCKKHEVTIRSWLQDESKIGPEDDADLICIALMTNSTLLYDNINTVRNAIRKMTGWRMMASDYIIEKIKAQIPHFADNTIINREIFVEGLGSVTILKVIDISKTWDTIDERYSNRLLQKEFI